MSWFLDNVVAIYWSGLAIVLVIMMVVAYWGARTPGRFGSQGEARFNEEFGYVVAACFAIFWPLAIPVVLAELLWAGIQRLRGK